MNPTTTTRMLLTTAVFAALAMLAVAPANAYFADVDGGGGGAAVAAPAPTVEPGTIPYLSHGIGVDETAFSGQADRLDTAIRTAMEARGAEQAAARQTDVETIPYLSHGIGVDESQFGGQRSLGLTGDSPLTRVAAPEPEGLTGDSALTRVDQPATVSTHGTSSGSDRDWTWVGLGAGLSALIAAAMAAVFFSARQRGRVALP